MATTSGEVMVDFDLQRGVVQLEHTHTLILLPESL